MVSQQPYISHKPISVLCFPSNKHHLVCYVACICTPIWIIIPLLASRCMYFIQYCFIPGVGMLHLGAGTELACASRQTEREEEEGQGRTDPCWEVGGGDRWQMWSSRQSWRQRKVWAMVEWRHVFQNKHQILQGWKWKLLMRFNLIVTYTCCK